LAGDDRYETATEIARDHVTAGSSTGLVIVSGESTADSLAAASLSTATRPIVLVRKDSIPESTADFISDYKADWVSGSPKIYVVGGEAAISAETYSAIAALVKTAGDTTPATPTRVSGADRYATSEAVADLTMNASDTLVIANGADGKWADALAVGPLASKGTWPILLTNGQGLSDDVKGQIDDYIALPGSALSVLIVGGPLAVSPAIESYLVSDAVGLAPQNLRRIGGADRYHTSFLLNVYMATETAYYGSFNSDNIALASGVSPWDALAASGWAAKKNAHIQLVPSTGSNTFSTTLFATSAALNDGVSAQTQTVYLLGGKTVMPAAALTAASAASTASAYTATLSGCNEGGTTATLTLSGQLPATTSGVLATRFAAAVGVGEAGDRFEVNGVDQDATDSTLISLLDLGVLTGVPARQIYQLTFGAALAEDDVIEFEGLFEGVTYTDGTSHVMSTTIGAASCTVEDDVTEPALTLVRAYPGAIDASSTTSSGPRVELRFNEPVKVNTTQSTATGTTSTLAIGDVDNTTNSDSNTVAALATSLNSSGSAWLIQIEDTDGMADWDASDVVTLAGAKFKDLAGNAYAESTIDATVGSTDTSAPALTVTAVECDNTTRQTTLTRGNLSISTVSGGAYSGAKAAGFKMAVNNQRGLEIPTVVIDGTARTITVTADVGYHTPADIARVMAQNWQTNALLGDWAITGNANALTATVTPVSAATAGLSTCTIDVSSNEAIIVDNGTYTLGGSLGGYGSVTAVAGSEAYTAGDEFGYSGATTRIGTTFTIRTAVLGSGTLVPPSSAGIVNTTDVYTSTPIEFTVS